VQGGDNEDDGLLWDPSVPPFVFFHSDYFFSFLFLSVQSLLVLVSVFFLSLSASGSLSLYLLPSFINASVICPVLLLLLLLLLLLFLFCMYLRCPLVFSTLPCVCSAMFSGSSPLCLLPLFSSVRPCSAFRSSPAWLFSSFYKTRECHAVAQTTKRTGRTVTVVTEMHRGARGSFFFFLPGLVC
jgi:hypothetical protein